MSGSMSTDTADGHPRCAKVRNPEFVSTLREGICFPARDYQQREGSLLAKSLLLNGQTSFDDSLS